MARDTSSAGTHPVFKSIRRRGLFQEVKKHSYMDDPTKLTRKEMEIYMQLTRGEVIPFSGRVHTLVGRLRGKLGEDFVETREGEGYIIGPNETTHVDTITWQVSRNKESSIG